MSEQTEETGTSAMAIELCRELYDRFVMGGWEPQDAHAWVDERLASVSASLKTQLTKFKRYYTEAFLRYEDAEKRVADLQAKLPESYYADRDLEFRVEMMVDGWQRAVKSNQRLETEIADLQAELERKTEALIYIAKDEIVGNEMPDAAATWYRSIAARALAGDATPDRK